MDFSKKYGSMKSTTVWVAFDDAKIELSPRGAKTNAFNAIHALTEQDVEVLQKNDKTVTTTGDMMRITARMAASYIIDWSGIYDDGEEVKYSPEKAFEFCFLHPEFKKFIEAEVARLKENDKDKVAVKEAIKKK